MKIKLFQILKCFIVSGGEKESQHYSWRDDDTPMNKEGKKEKQTTLIKNEGG